MSRAAATQSWVGLNPGHLTCYWSFNERRCVVRRRGVSLLSARGDDAGRRPSDERHSRIGTRRIRAQFLGEADGAAATRRARARTSKRDWAKTPSWRTHPLRSEDAHPDQDPRSTLRTAHGRRIGGVRCRRLQDGRRLSGRRWRNGEERTGVIELATTGRTPDPVGAHLHASAREHMLEEALEKLDAGERDAAKALSPIVPIAEGDLVVLNSFQTAVGEGDAEM